MASSTFSSRPASPPRYSPSLREPSPRPSSVSSGVPVLSSGSDSTRNPSFESIPPVPASSDAITRLESGQAPLLFSSPQIINQRSLFPDPRKLKNKLDLGRDGVHLTLLQKFVFLNPPSPSDGTGEHGRSGKDGRVNGFVHVTASSDKTIDAIRVTLIGHQSLYFPSDGGKAEEKQILKREILLGGADTGGIHLKPGLNSFEFTFTVPATAMTYERTPCGSAKHDVRVEVVGIRKGFFGGSKMEDEAELFFVSVPSRDEGVLALSLSQEGYHSSLGPSQISLRSSQLTVGAPVDVLLHLASPPPGLTIYAVNVYIVQTVQITSSRDPTRTHEVRRPKAYVLHAGAEGPYGVHGAAKKMRKEGKVLWENAKDGGGEYRLEKMARMPDDTQMRPTTHAGTESSLRVSNEIFADIVFSLPSEPDRVMIATVIERPVVVCSCCALVESVVLPDYKQCTDPFVLPRSNCPCMCSQPWETLEKRELAFRNQPDALERGVEESRGARRTRTPVLESGPTSCAGSGDGEEGRERKIGESW